MYGDIGYSALTLYTLVNSKNEVTATYKTLKVWSVFITIIFAASSGISDYFTSFTPNFAWWMLTFSLRRC